MLFNPEICAMSSMGGRETSYLTGDRTECVPLSQHHGVWWIDRLFHCGQSDSYNAARPSNGHPQIDIWIVDDRELSHGGLNRNVEYGGVIRLVSMRSRGWRSWDEEATRPSILGLGEDAFPKLARHWPEGLRVAMSDTCSKSG